MVLFGATGFTGRLAAEAMTRAGMAPVLAGRSAEALVDLVADLAPLAPIDRPPTWRRADVTDPASVRALVDGPQDVLVSTVGPFTRLGRPTLDAAIDAGCGYVDSTGEPPFIRTVFEQDGPRAEATGARLLTAFGYDYVPGNLAGALAVREAGTRPVTEVEIGYFVDGGLAISSGTRASLAAVALQPGFGQRGGRISADPGRTATFDVGGHRLSAMSIGGSEHFALPRWDPRLRDVGVFLGWAGRWTPLAQGGRRVLAGLAAVPGARALMDTALSRATDGPTGRGPDARSRAQGRTICVARTKDGVGRVLSSVRIEGPTPYELTADLLAWAAAMLLTHPADAGALGPVDAFGLEGLERGCADIGLRQVA